MTRRDQPLFGCGQRLRCESLSGIIFESCRGSITFGQTEREDEATELIHHEATKPRSHEATK